MKFIGGVAVGDRKADKLFAFLSAVCLVYVEMVSASRTSKDEAESSGMLDMDDIGVSRYCLRFEKLKFGGKLYTQGDAAGIA